MTDPESEAEFIEVDEVIVPDRAKIDRSHRKKGARGRSPKSGQKEGQQDRLEVPRSPIAKLLAFVLDDCIVIPGTNIRIGLDPILGLIPGGGEAIASVAGSFIIGEAYRKGMSMKVVFRMVGNLLLNAGVGAIPGIGDAFSAIFKSNSRNYTILDDFLENPPPEGKRRRLWPIVLGIGLIALALNIGIWLLIVWPIWQLIAL